MQCLIIKMVENSLKPSKLDESGVLLRSVLGCLPFLVRINDLPQGLRCVVRLFPEDTYQLSLAL